MKSNCNCRKCPKSGQCKSEEGIREMYEKHGDNPEVKHLIKILEASFKFIENRKHSAFRYFEDIIEPSEKEFLN